LVNCCSSPSEFEVEVADLFMTSLFKAESKTPPQDVILFSVQFIHAVVENCPEHRITSCGGVLLSALNKLVMNKSATSTSNSDGEEQPLTNAEINAAAKLRASCYVAIGKLGLKMPQLVNKDITIIQTFSRPCPPKIKKPKCLCKKPCP
jgi:hypothetical protein